MKRDQSHFRGCIIGGAIGDALGWPVEFLRLNDIIKRYGPNGITDLVINKSGLAEITDDTQMTLFTAEGILRAQTRGHLKGICHEPALVYYAYQRWLYTQGYPQVETYGWAYDGWLIRNKELFARRAPGNSCISALTSMRQGTKKTPVNNSKGCGGVMRIAPVGLFYPKKQAFEMAADFAALTHGHPSGYLSAGAAAYLTAALIEGMEIENAVEETAAVLKKYESHQECSLSLRNAIKLSQSNLTDYEAIEHLGEGWTGEEALAISVYCALKYKDDFKKALIAAVNHNGDSDSTGAITGNILGAYLGVEAIPTAWMENVELKDVILEISDDLLIEYNEENVNWDKYPGY